MPREMSTQSQSGSSYSTLLCFCTSRINYHVLELQLSLLYTDSEKDFVETSKESEVPRLCATIHVVRHRFPRNPLHLIRLRVGERLADRADQD